MLTVSIVTYNTPLGELGQCLDSLGVGVVERVFVVDNSRSDDIMRFAISAPMWNMYSRTTADMAQAITRVLPGVSGLVLTIIWS